MNSIVLKLSGAWKRKLVSYSGAVLAMYLDEGLTGWVLIIDEPVIEKFNGLPCVCVNLCDWIHMKELGATTVTPFRVVAKGKGLIVKGFMPHTGLKYPVRDVNGAAMLHIPVEDFKSV